MDKYQIKNELIRDIIDGKYTLDQVEIIIQELEAEYGEGFFDDYDVPKEEKPWNRETLKKLETDSLVGTCSKPFILHLAEVSEYVHNEERKDEYSKKKINRLRIIVIAITVIIVIFAVILCSTQANDTEETQELQETVTQIDAQLFQAVENRITIEVNPDNIFLNYSGIAKL